MKRIHLIIILLFVLCFSIHTHAEEKNIEYIDGFEKADFDKFNSYASDNGLKMTPICVEGTVHSVWTTDDYLGYVICVDKKKTWLVIEGYKTQEDVNNLEAYYGKTIRAFGIYNGFSDVYHMPGVVCMYADNELEGKIEVKKEDGSYETVWSYLEWFIDHPEYWETEQESSGNEDDSSTISETESAIVETQDANSGDTFIASTTYLDIHKNYDGDVVFDGLMSIKNISDSNLLLYDCRFDLEDTEGKLIATSDALFSFPKIIAPGEYAYLYNPFSTRIEDGKLDEEYVLKAEVDTKETSDPIIYLDATDVSVQTGVTGAPMIIGRVANNSESDISYFYLTVVFFDEDGNAIGMSGTDIDDLPAGSQKSFDIDCMLCTDPVKEGNYASYKLLLQCRG